MHERDYLAERFEEHRTHLRAVAYRMLGSSGEVDDAVQEAWLRLSRVDAAGIDTIILTHMHPDHSTICWLQTGKLRVHINGETFLASPGDVWQHPRGIPHYHEVIEEGHVIEIKSPASKTW